MTPSSARAASLALLLLGACTVREGGSDTSSAARIDTTNGLLAGKPARVDSSPASVTKKLVPIGPDSATRVRGGVPADSARDSTATPPAGTPAPISMSSPTAGVSRSDLDILRRELITPLASVPLAALHDTYNEMRGTTRRHDALDILAPRGTPVRSAAAGRLLKLFSSKAGGLMVYAADSTEHFILMYGHLDGYQPGLVEGQHLTRGQLLGIVGTTGNAPANTPHLHFAVARSDDMKKWWKGEPVNPYPLLKP